MEFKPEKIYLAAGATDLRAGIDGYAHIVENSFEMKAMTDAMFIFCNRSRNKIKILYWDKNGFWLLYKRLEKGTFKYPRENTESIVITEQQLRWLLEGLNIWQKRAFKEVKAEYEDSALLDQPFRRVLVPPFRLDWNRLSKKGTG